MSRPAAPIEMIDLQFEYLVAVLQRIKLQTVAVNSFVALGWNVDNDSVVFGDQKANLTSLEGERFVRKSIDLVRLEGTNSEIGVSNFFRHVPDVCCPDSMSNHLPIDLRTEVVKVRREYRRRNQREQDEADLHGNVRVNGQATCY